MSEKVGKIYAAMAAVMGDVAPVAKNKENRAQGFNFRGIDDIYNALNGIMAKHGVVSVPTVLDLQAGSYTNSKGTVFVTRIAKILYKFYAADGSSIESTVIGEGHDMGDKASSKALAVAHKYALLQAFCIPTEEPKDPEADAGRQAEAEAALANPGQRWELAKKALASVGKTDRDMLNYVKRAEPKDVTEQDFEKLRAWYDELSTGRTE